MKKIINVSLFIMLILIFHQQITYAQKIKGTVKSNGVNMAYESFGPSNGEAILMIMGTGSQLTDWPVMLCTQLAALGYWVIRFDNRDAGLSSRLDSLGMPDWEKVIPDIGTCNTIGLPYTLNDMVKDAVGLLDALHIQKAHVVGASMGGAIAQLMAIHYPSRIISLTTLGASTGDPSLPKGNPEALKLMSTPPPQTDNMNILTKYLFTINKALSSPGYPTPDSILMKHARADIERSWYPEGTARQAAAVIIADNCDRRPDLQNLKIPVVIIQGEADPVVSVAAARELAETINNSGLIIIPEMGHDLPEELIPIIREGILLAVRRGSNEISSQGPKK